MEIPNFLKKDGNKLLYNGKPGSQLIYYIPEVYFTNKCASIEGAYVKTIGIFDYSIVDKTGKNNGLHTFKFQAAFLSKPSHIEKVKNVKLTKFTEVSDYRLLKFNVGDECVTNIRVPQLVDNVEKFFQMFFITSNISTTIPYIKLHDYFDETMNLSGHDFSLHKQIFGMICGELVKDPKDLSLPFRLSKYFDESTAYRLVSLVQNPKHLGSYISITSQNFDESLIGAILSNDNTPGSPLEKILVD